MDDKIRKALLEIEQEFKAMDSKELAQYLIDSEQSEYGTIFEIFDMFDENKKNYPNIQTQGTATVSLPTSSASSPNNLLFAINIIVQSEKMKEFRDRNNVDYELELPWTAA